MADEIRAWARTFLPADPHAGGWNGDGYHITSLYFETAAFDVYSRRASYGRCKYRIRRYNIEPTCFLERKLKTRRMLTKRRCLVGLDALSDLAAEPQGEDWDGFWFQRRLQLRGLRQVCQVSYQRTARVARTPLGPIRLTLDEDLRALPTEWYRFQEQAGEPVLPGLVVLELKYMLQVPGIFKELVRTFGVSPRKFSKYRRSAAALGICTFPDVGADVPELITTIPAYA